MDIYEFVGKMAEQHGNLLKVIELQNSSIQSLNQRVNALAASQLVVTALLLDSEQLERQRLAQHLELMLANEQVKDNPYLVAQLRELQELCKDKKEQSQNTAETETRAEHPNWFKGIIQGGLGQ